MKWSEVAMGLVSLFILYYAWVAILNMGSDDIEVVQEIICIEVVEDERD